MNYIRGMRKLPLTLGANGSGILKWYIDSSYTPVFSVSDIDAILERPYQSPQPPAPVQLALALKCLLLTPLPSASLLSVAGEGMMCDKFCHAVHEHATLPS